MPGREGASDGLSGLRRQVTDGRQGTTYARLTRRQVATPPSPQSTATPIFEELQTELGPPELQEIGRGQIARWGDLGGRGLIFARSTKTTEWEKCARQVKEVRRHMTAHGSRPKVILMYRDDQAGSLPLAWRSDLLEVVGVDSDEFVWFAAEALSHFSRNRSTISDSMRPVLARGSTVWVANGKLPLPLTFFMLTEPVTSNPTPEQRACEQARRLAAAATARRSRVGGTLAALRRLGRPE